ncbi:MAG TPA: adenylate kinase [Kineosporiaceae bacterium]|nr:adenylate kinase [Kineosporiaceae bacterium]
MRLVLLGPPGAGKGTQAKRLAAHLGVPAISTGDIFRSNIAESSELGLLAQSYLDAGKLVPDEVTNDMVEDRIAQADCGAGFVLDGYPRNVAQVGALDAMLAAHDARLDAVVELTVDQDEVIERLKRRAQLEGRSDDTEDVIRHRQDVYVEQTAPLVDVYRERGLLVQVDGMGDVDGVTGRLTAALPASRG